MVKSSESRMVSEDNAISGKAEITAFKHYYTENGHAITSKVNDNAIRSYRANLDIVRQSVT